jgi:probable F420-dependent oxidoreductase
LTTVDHVLGDLGFTLPLIPLPPSDQLTYAQAAESLGYSSCWLGEGANFDSFSLGGAIAARTSLQLATSIVPIYNRTPMILAMSAAALAHMTESRFILGLGSSTPNMMSGWNGVPLERPLLRMRETISVVRRLLRGEKVTFTGETLHIENARLDAPPRNPPPIYIAALNKKMLRLAGEVADGVILNLLGPQHLPLLLAEVAAGAEVAGRDRTEIDVVVRLQIVADVSREEAHARARSTFGPYIAAPGYNTFYRWIGYDEEAKAVAEAMRSGRRSDVEKVITDDLADALVVYGSVTDCRRRFDEYRTAGADKVVTIPLAKSRDECWRTLCALAPRAAANECRGRSLSQ